VDAGLVSSSPIRLISGFAALIALCPPSSRAQTSVLTFHNDNSRLGQNVSETRLRPDNVNPSMFGKLFTLPVDGKVDAQPLYVAGLSFPGSGTHNVVLVATEHDSVYAFDADTSALLWQVSLLKPGETTSDVRNCGQVVPEIGITSTGVIDRAAGPHGTIYLVAMSKDGSGAYHQRFHALDLTTGAEQFNGPVEIQASYPGTGDNTSNGEVIFDPKQYKERAALLLVNGIVYTSWTSHCDIRPYTGWTLGYDQLTLAQVRAFNFAPNGIAASVWSSGSGPAADSEGNLFFQLANGTFDTTLDSRGFPSRGDFGNAFVKLGQAQNSLQPLDYWTMFNTKTESDHDVDLGSGGFILFPDVTDASGQVRHLGTGAGKDANIYVFDRDNMGKFNSSGNSNLYQQLSAVLASGAFSSPAWFNGTVYYGAVGDSIKAFSLTQGRLSSAPTSMTANIFGYPGVTPSISANVASDAILWAVENSSPAVLHAYDATNLANELYNSNQAPSGRDQFGPGNKFITPTIADGKVFVGTTNSVAVFGLLNGSMSVGNVSFSVSSINVPPGVALGTATLTRTAPMQRMCCK
jgi:hypothetical protein